MSREQVFTQAQLCRFSTLATERAERDAANMWPPGEERERAARELMPRYYAEYVTPPAAEQAVAQGDGEWNEVDSLCAALGDMFAGDTLDRVQAARLDDTRKLLRQLQARNAEQAAEIAELDAERARQAGRVFEERAKLATLAAGIEGLEEQMRMLSKEEGSTGFARWLSEEANRLKALREAK